MPSVRSLIAARARTREGLQALAAAIAAEVGPPAELPEDPAALWDAVETRTGAGTWDDVRAAVDHGELSEAEYDYLAAAVATDAGGTR